MRKTPDSVSWVVYRRTLHNNPTAGIAICEQTEWDEMESANPGYHTLICAGIVSEVEAECMARSQPGVTPARPIRLKART